jgi:3',5'-cyclic AMP phosphodiesterase CpdA
MIAEFLDARLIERYVDAVGKALDDPQLQAKARQAAETIGRGASDPAAAVRATLPVSAGPPSSGGHQDYPFFSRDSVVSLIQTSLEDEARQAGNVTEEPHEHGLKHFWHSIERLLHIEKFGPDDPDWVLKIAEAMLDRLARGNHAFNATAAQATMADDARLVIVGDWGSGLPRARTVAALMGAKIDEARKDGHEVHVIHLGDVYYSGDPVEYKRHVLAQDRWPVAPDNADEDVKSWALMGNHDMYSGGYGFYETLLADRRFKQQSANGSGTSFFRLSSGHWDVAGLDSSWDPNVLSLGQRGVLQNPQADVLERWAADGRKLMVLTHHQLVSAYDLGDLGTVLPFKLRSLLKAGRIDAWMWGHEHRCMGFGQVQDAPKVIRCIGNGGIPMPASSMKEPSPPPGTWQSTGTFTDKDGTWTRFGFAVLDFNGATVTANYYDDTNPKPVFTETF